MSIRTFGPLCCLVSSFCSLLSSVSSHWSLRTFLCLFALLLIFVVFHAFFRKVESDTRLTLDSARLRLDSRDSTLTLSQLTRYPHSRVSRSKVQRHDGRICICNLDQPVPHHTFSFVFISYRFRHLHHLRTLSFFSLKDARQPSDTLVKYGSQ